MSHHHGEQYGAGNQPNKKNVSAVCVLTRVTVGLFGVHYMVLYYTITA